MKVTELGMGPTLVLLHGNASPQTLEPLANELASDFRILLPDVTEICPGDLLDTTGRRRCREAVSEMVDQRTDVAQVSIVGHADGCYRAFDLALSGDISIGALVALGPFEAPAEADAFELFIEKLGRITAPVYLRTNVDHDDADLARRLQRHLSNATLDLIDGEDNLDDTAESITDFLLGARRTDVLDLADVLTLEDE